MSNDRDKKIKELANLNQVALKEFEILLDQNKDLLPEWKQAVVALLATSVTPPKDIDSIRKLLTGKQNDQTSNS